MSWYYPYAAIFALFIIILKLVSIIYNNGGRFKKSKPSLFMPGFELFYSDNRSAVHDKHISDDIIYSKLLHSEKYGLHGKPDFIYKKRNRAVMVPVELKSGSIGKSVQPHKGDLMQLAAYFAIIEDVYSIKPKKGLLIYKDYMFTVKNSSWLRREILSTVAEMRDMLVTADGEADPSFSKCKGCVCRGTVCEYYS